MGRSEKPLDPASGPVQRFAHELRLLRQKAGGPTYRAMARTAPYAAPTLSAAAAGDRLPSPAVTRAYVLACGGDPEEWERRRAEAEEEAFRFQEAAAAGDDGASPPYPGLGRFEAEHRERFFGREAVLDDLAELVGRHAFVAVVGASGSGKSSLLRAGLVPALRDGRCGPVPPAIRILTPGEHPSRIGREVFADDAVVLVDQFEEVFTLCRDRQERAVFIDRLAAARGRVVIAVRADFYGRCAEHPALASALRPPATLLLGPMTPAQLRQAIVGPAVAERLIVERELTARIVADIADEPGGLPLMSHALLETWRRRRGRAMTVAAYEAIGGVRGAVAHTAEAVFTGLDDVRAAAARALLLRLVSPGGGTEDTGRSVARSELAALDELDRAEDVLEQLVRARLLTVDDQMVSLAHEALIGAWPRLRSWVESDRELMRLHRRLTEAAHTWDALERDTGALYRGGQLESAREAFMSDAVPDSAPSAASTSVLTSVEREFLAASIAEHDRERRTAERAARTLRGLVAALSVLLCLTAVAGLAAWQQGRTAERRATEAEARRVAAVAGTLRRSDPRAAMRLSVAAWHLADLPETREALYGAAAQRDLNLLDAGSAELAPDDNDTWRRLSHDGRTLTVVGPERTRRWNVAAGRRLPDLAGLGRRAEDIVAVSPDTRTVALRSAEGVRLWDLVAGRPKGGAFGPQGDGVHVWFGPDARTVALHEDGGSLQVWDAGRGQALLDTGRRWDEVRTLDIAPDGRLIAFCPDGEALQVWDVRRHRRLLTPWAAKADVCDQDRFRFTPDGQALAVGVASALRTWEVRSGRERPRITTDGPPDAAFSTDGSHVATLAGGELRLWRTADPSVPLLRQRGITSSTSELVLDLPRGVIRYTEGNNLVSAVRTVALTGTEPRERRERPFSAAGFSPDGTRLVTVRPGEIELRDGATGLRRDTFAAASCATCPPVPVTAFGRDSRTLAYLSTPDTVTLRTFGPHPTVTSLPSRPGVDGIATGGPQSAVVTRTSYGVDFLAPGEPRGTLPRKRYGSLLDRAPDGRIITDERQLIDPTEGRGSARVVRVMRGEGPAEVAVFSPDGRYLAMSDQDGRVTLWGSDGSTRLAVLTPGAEAGTGRERHPSALAFSTDGRLLAVGDAEGELRFWSTDAPRSAGSPLPPADGPVLALAFGPDASRLRVATGQTPVRTYPLGLERTARAVCVRAGGGLSRAAWASYLPSVSYRETC
ncbi:nSTAND1 domain-containing NTPase [Streptomyces rubiginosohelvolus]|uniref:nSTAND1 domain-containing NTPase n=1 Tax=Streptomyces rubiginosohelvolus TaxID=67362 RepID=UPI0033A13C6C